MPWLIQRRQQGNRRMNGMPKRLSKYQLFCYGITDMPLHFALTPVLIFVPKFYTAELGVSLFLVGNMFLFARVLDVFTDPLIGYWSDRTRTKWGRRRPWIVAGAPIMTASFYYLFLPPEGAGALHLFICMMGLYLALTMILIPYYSWAAELSPDYRERSRITGWRSAIGITGNMAAQFVPIFFLYFFDYGGDKAVMTILGIMMVITLPLGVFLTVTQVPEPKEYNDSTTPIIKGLKLMWQNGPFKRLIAALMIGSTAFNITTPLYSFFVGYVLGAPTMTIVMLAFFYTSNMLGVPFWVKLSHRIGKHRAYAASFILIGCVHPLYIFHGWGDFWWMIPITITSGFAGGAFAVLPNSMKADVIDLDNMMSGDNRAASFFATWSFTAKMSAAVGGWIALNMLALIGFVPQLGAENSNEHMLGLRILFTVPPAILFFVAAAIVWSYPITEKRHTRMRQALERRANRRASREAAPAGLTGA
jgi:glycoside/pentoside/hexuronide:cation symporter, GPH family